MQEDTNQAESKIAYAENSAKEANARAEKADKDCAAAQASETKERDLRGKAELAEANVRADLKIAQAALTAAKEMHAKHEAMMKDMEAKMEQQRKVVQELTIKAATEERLRMAAEKRVPAKSSAPSAMPMMPMGYEVEVSQRNSDGGLRKLVLTPMKAH